MIFNKDPDIVQGRERNEEFNTVRERNLNNFPGRSKGHLIQLTREELKKALGPLIPYIERKAKQQRAAKQGIAEHDDLLDKLRAVDPKAPDTNAQQLIIIKQFEE